MRARARGCGVRGGGDGRGRAVANAAARSRGGARTHAKTSASWNGPAANARVRDGDRSIEARALHSKGDHPFTAGAYEEALDALQPGRGAFEQHSATAWSLGRVYNSIGRLYRVHERHDEALTLPARGAGDPRDDRPAVRAAAEPECRRRHAIRRLADPATAPGPYLEACARPRGTDQLAAHSGLSPRQPRAPSWSTRAPMPRPPRSSKGCWREGSTPPRAFACATSRGSIRGLGRREEAAALAERAMASCKVRRCGAALLWTTCGPSPCRVSAAARLRSAT